MHVRCGDRCEATNDPFVLAIKESKYSVQIGRFRFPASSHIHYEDRQPIGSAVSGLESHVEPSERVALLIVHPVPDRESRVFGNA